MHSLLDWFFGRGYAICLTLSPWLAMGSLFISAPSAGQHPLPRGLGCLRLAAAAWRLGFWFESSVLEFLPSS